MKFYCPNCEKELTLNKFYDERSLKNDEIGIQNYKFECLRCDENFFEIETIEKEELNK